MSKVEFDTLMKEISNWGRWGKDDQLVTLNLITPATRLMATSLVQNGTAVSLTLPLNKVKDALNVNPFEHQLFVGEFGGHQVAKDGQWDLMQHAAGSLASLAAWLKQRDVAMICSDGISDVVPSGVEGLFNPLHQLLLVGLGMPILDNLDLEAVARLATLKKRSTFLFVAAPLRVEGCTGSPVNPLAIF